LSNNKECWEGKCVVTNDWVAYTIANGDQWLSSLPSRIETIYTNSSSSQTLKCNYRYLGMNVWSLVRI